ncbi:hypothetical protein FGIG_04856 [Fasciola gigantica]|uniref:Uncharacterized protein n=1 Tax=Fasciola gigantica TaxID=46835 RepID=A0A504YS34_FASGI|nr:hypothetical protein FGIG_04856 [Fasciola gigantica]
MRLVYTPAEHLWPCEMARSAIELHLNSESPTVQLASVSLLGDWISRRIGLKNPKSFTRSSNKTKNPYTHMVYAQLMDTRSIFAGFERTGVLERGPV